jgi:hypothetical protein
LVRVLLPLESPDSVDSGGGEAAEDITKELGEFGNRGLSRLGEVGVDVGAAVGYESAPLVVGLLLCLICKNLGWTSGFQVHTIMSKASD